MAVDLKNVDLEELKKQIEAEEEKRKKLEKLGIDGLSMDIDLSTIESRLDALVINGNNQVKLLERLNLVGDRTYAKLEELSLKLLELMAVGMPLLNKVS